MFRAFLSVGLAVLFSTMMAGCKREGAAGPVTLKYANFPPAATFPCVQMEQWKTEIEKRTGGQIKIQTFPGSTLLNPKNMFDGVKDGTADIGCFAMSYQPGRFPVSEACDLPVGFTSARVASLTLFDLIQKHNPKEFADVKVITTFTCAPVNFMTSKPVQGLADLKGMKLRAAATGLEAMKLLGASPDAMPQSEVPDALQKGRVEGIVSSLEVLQDMNYANYCKYSTRKVDLNVVTFAVVMNKKRWESLPDDVKKAIDGMAREHAEWTGAYADKHVEDAIAWAKEKHGHQVLELSTADQKQVGQALAPMFATYLERATKAGIDGAKVVEDVKAMKQKIESQAK